MKGKMRRFITLALAAVLVAGVLAGCGGSDGGYDPDAEVTMENAPLINVVIPAIGTHTESAADVEEKINEILVKTAGAKIKITWSDFGNLTQQVNMMLTNDDELDIAYITGGPQNYVDSGELLDLTDYMATEDGQAIRNAVGGEFVDASMYQGRNYYIPNIVDRAQEFYFMANRALVDELGMEFDDEKIWTLQEIHDLVTAVLEKHPEIYGVVGISSRFDSDGLGDSYNIGVVEQRGNSEKVVSITESQEFIDFCKTMRSWYNEGIIMPDILSSDSTYMLVYAGQAVGMLAAGACPNGMEGSDSYRYLMSLGSQWISSEAAQRMGYIINAKTKYPDQAFKVLKEMYTNEEVKKLLCFGIEGVNYVLDDQGRAAYPEGVNSETATYNVGFQNWFVFPNGQCDVAPFTNSPDYWDLSRNYDDTAEVSGCLGLIFDSTNCAEAYAACMNVYDEYYEAILCGTVDTDEGIAKYRDELKKAGEDKVIAEKQAQLDSFRSSK